MPLEPISTDVNTSSTTRASSLPSPPISSASSSPASQQSQQSSTGSPQQYYSSRYHMGINVGMNLMNYLSPHHMSASSSPSSRTHHGSTQTFIPRAIQHSGSQGAAERERDYTTFVNSPSGGAHTTSTTSGGGTRDTWLPRTVIEYTSSSRTSGRISAQDMYPESFDPANIRPQFRSKVVCELKCRYCTSTVCKRGMKAILLADMNVELYSTDLPPFGVQLVNEDYQTRNCHCRIRDVACLGCGNVLGYHVTQPCPSCMDACNNGHFWMLHTSEVESSDRLTTGSNGLPRPMLWAHLPGIDKEKIDEPTEQYDRMCR
ncbi:hypothetical protein SmJEL517_g05893 [Synchytrium microbalum]|uniref:Protein FAM72 n=1 Tax=Synchytrium microbalum TaxID=1806994 RepID=A0A507BXP0_9FUNG|nr:uncharacterized protein SmJEL517_g05893 [Synchytrium microbalum]TPX30554.1 hypothetical protein SmJEL517_g05893 [Synchytrium microbalum]